MRQTRLVAVCLLIFALFVGMMVQAQESTDEPAPESTEQATQPAPETTSEPVPDATEEPSGGTGTSGGTTYIVQPGDNLFRIALRNGTTVSVLAQANGIVNPSLIFVGQEIVIPTSGTTPPATTTPAPEATTDPTPDATEEPTTDPTPAPTGGATYTVQPGDTLFRIAVRNGTTVQQLVALNNIANPSLIFVGQQITLPGGDASEDDTSTGDGDTSDNSDTTDDGNVVSGEPNPNFGYGIEVFTAGQDVNAIASQVTQLGADWVKISVSWAEIEPDEGSFNFDELDSMVSLLAENGVNVILNVHDAPDWARPSATEFTLQLNAPPDDNADFGNFVSELATRYAGQVQAYEIWKAPNIVPNWAVGTYVNQSPDQNPDSFELGADHYVDLLEVAHTAIKAIDPEAWVVTAGLAPTELNDNYNAIDDRVFLQDMFSNDVEQFSDAIGAVYGGAANPPNSTCCEQQPGVDTHFESRAHYLLDTLNDYREIIDRNDGEDISIWVTRFGWGTTEGGILAPAGTNFEFLAYTSQAEQSLYVPQAFELGQSTGVGPMFLFNLNGCAVGDASACYYSLIDSAGVARPVFSAFQGIDKSN